MSRGKPQEEGVFDEKGHWRPSDFSYSPLFQLPWKPLAILQWLFRWGGYLWPQNLSYALLAGLTWFFLQADLAATRTLSPGWIGFMLLRNLVMMLGVYGFYHLTLYVWRVQKSKRKYNPQWQTKNSSKFLFRDQVRDNMFLCLFSGAPLWTAWEVFYFWAAGRGWTPLITWGSNPIWFAAFFLIIPLWRETHFYFVHRLLHWKPFLRSIHKDHHRNPNPGPWSGMAMHPVEHFLYFSVLLIHFVVPSHPIHLLFNAQTTALTPANSHIGFEGPLYGDAWPVGDYFHYLHHRYVSCNFGGDLIPWDKWLGRFYDGNGPYHIKK